MYCGCDLPWFGASHKRGAGSNGMSLSDNPVWVCVSHFQLETKVELFQSTATSLMMKNLDLEVCCDAWHADARWCLAAKCDLLLRAARWEQPHGRPVLYPAARPAPNQRRSAASRHLSWQETSPRVPHAACLHCLTILYLVTTGPSPGARPPRGRHPSAYVSAAVAGAIAIAPGIRDL